MIEKGLVAFLLTQAPVTAICEDRIFPQASPEDAAFPHITLERGGTGRQSLLGQTQGNPVEATVHATCWALTYQDAKTLADTLRTSLKAAMDTRGSGGAPVTMGTFAVQSMRITDDVDGYAPPQEGEAAGIFGTTMTLTPWFNE